MDSDRPSRDVARSSGTAKHRFASDDRGLSELIGFSLTFAIILVSVTLVATVGFSQLSDFRKAQQLDNAEQSFETLGQSLDSIEERDAVMRTGAIDLASGSIKVTQGSTATVTIRNSAGNNIYSTTLSLNALVYSRGSTNISYESGATFRSQPGGSIMNSGPGFVCNDEAAVLSFVTLNASGRGKLSSDGTVSITATHNGTELVYPIEQTGPGSASSAASVTVTISSPRVNPWIRHFEADSDWSTGSTTITCGSTANPLEQIYIRRTNVSIAFVS